MTTPEKTIRRESILLRVLWMLLFLLVWQVAVPLLALLVVAQLLYRLFYGAPSGLFMSFGDSLSQYLAQIGRFAVFNTDEKPWPIADWPTARAAEGEPAHRIKEVEADEDAAEPLVAEADTETDESAVDAEEVPVVTDVVTVDEAAESENPAVSAEDQQSNEPKP